MVPDPGNTKSFDRYSYVFNNPICYTDPSGNLVCLDDGYCGGAGSTAYQNRIYANAITYLFQWRLQGAFTKKESNVIAQSGYDILSYAEGGLTWMRNNFGGTVFTHSAISSIALPNNPHVFGNMVVLTQNWVNSYENPNQVIAHELGHVWDNKSSSSGLGTYIGGGVADKLYSFLSGIDKSPTGVRFWNPNDKDYIDPQIRLLDSENHFEKEHYYGNGCTADYYAETFAWGIYNPSVVPGTALIWMRAFISLDASD